MMRIVLFFELAFLLNLGVYGQRLGTPRTLRLSVSMTEKNVCQSESYPYIVELVNVGKRSLIVDVNGIGSSVFITPFKQSSKGSQDKSHLLEEGIPTHQKPNFKVLQPMESISKKLEFTYDRVYFPKVGRYRIEIGFGQHDNVKFEEAVVWNGIIYSNETIVIVNRCDAGAKHPDPKRSNK